MALLQKVHGTAVDDARLPRSGPSDYASCVQLRLTFIGALSEVRTQLEIDMTNPQAPNQTPGQNPNQQRPDQQQQQNPGQKNPEERKQQEEQQQQ